jgi:hypothetical protein
MSIPSTDPDLFPKEVNIKEAFLYHMDFVFGNYPINLKIKEGFVDLVVDSLSTNHLDGAYIPELKIQEDGRDNIELLEVEEMEWDGILPGEETIDEKGWHGIVLVSGDPADVLESLAHYSECLPKALEKMVNDYKDKIQDRTYLRGECNRKLFYGIIGEISNSHNSGVGLENRSIEISNAFCASFDSFLNTAAEIGYTEVGFDKDSSVDPELALAVGMTKLVDPHSPTGIIKIRDIVEFGVKVYVNHYEEKKGRRLRDDQIKGITANLTHYLGKRIIFSGRKEGVVQSLSQFREGLTNAYDNLAKDSFARNPTDRFMKGYIRYIEKNGPFEAVKAFGDFLKSRIYLLARDIVGNYYNEGKKISTAEKAMIKKVIDGLVEEVDSKLGTYDN